MQTSRGMLDNRECLINFVISLIVNVCSTYMWVNRDGVREGGICMRNFIKMRENIAHQS